MERSPQGAPHPAPELPENESSPGGLAALLAANQHYRRSRWPEPFDQTSHDLRSGDARDLGFLADASVDLVVTSPPYWTLKRYQDSGAQMGHIEEYEAFLAELDRVWRECARVLRPGGRICCVVGDVCLARRDAGRHHVVPLHADIQVRARSLGLDCLTPVLWHKIANGATEAKGNGSAFYGKPYQPGQVLKNDIEYVLFLRRPGGYRKPTQVQKALSMFTREEMTSWFRTFWTDLPGASTRSGHPAPYPVELAERLIRMFSFAGDTVLDPFLGTGSTSVAAIRAGRSSVGVEVEPAYLAMAVERVRQEASVQRIFGPKAAMVRVSGPLAGAGGPG